MAEENQETKGQNQETMRGPKEVTTRGPKEMTTKGPKEVTTKDPRRVEQGKKLQQYNRRRKEEWEVQKSAYQYVIRVVIAVGVIGGLGYYLYQAKKGEVNVKPPQTPRPKFEMD